MSEPIPLLILLVLLALMYAPVFLQRRKVDLMADFQLRKSDSDEWHRHVKWKAMSLFVVRIACLFVFLFLVGTGALTKDSPFDAGSIALLVVAAGLFVMAAVSFRSSMKTFKEGDR
jgi:hypothetical protein